MQKLEVRLAWRSSESLRVGQLLEDRGKVYFEYDAAFLQGPLRLSPFKLPPMPGLIEHRERDFGPIFGLFDDSLPDGWGLLLMDRFFRHRGRSPREVTVLERLAYLGTRTMGALTYHPPSQVSEQDPRILDLHEMARASEQVLRGSSEDVFPRLLRAGGSPGGARPKVLVAIKGEDILSGEDELPAGFEGWLVKFPGAQDPADVGALELVYSRLAAEAGINMPETRLFTAKEERFFGVKRFDREGNHRIHVHTLGNLIHADFRLPSCDYREVLHVTRRLTGRQEDTEQCFRRMAFNVAANNRDDHAKNFAFLLDKRGEWRLAPAYDLTFSTGPGGEHTTSVADEGRRPKRAHLLSLAPRIGLDSGRAGAIIDEVVAAVERFEVQACEFGISEMTRSEVRRTLSRRREDLRKG